MALRTIERVSYNRRKVTVTAEIQGVSESLSWGFLAVMGSLFSTPTRRFAALIALVVPLPAGAETAVGAVPQAIWPAAVAAHYNLSFGGFDVGKYQFQSKFDGKSYTVSSDASVSALFGAFKWKGALEAKGAIEAHAARPAGYQLNFKTKAKEGQVKLGFDKSGVSVVTLVPAKPPSPEAVPVKPEHLKNVFDPLTAIVAMTHAGGAAPCDRKIPVFDGKARFDLQLSLKGEQRLTEKKPSGQPANLIVCRVKYVPIAGHKPKDFANPWVDYNGIEITFRPIPSANVNVPYRLSIPTSIGSAVMTADRIDITAANKSVIALTQ